jgi:protocatechuate 3,4-dioxygenase beta subunit
MRRLMVVVGLLVLAAVAWFFLLRDGGALSGGRSSADAGAPADAELEAVAAKEKQKRKHAQPTPREESVSDFLAQWPEIAQDVPQDPKLGAITGRVLAGVERPVLEAVVESAQGAEATARARTKSDGSFLLKNVPVGRGTSLTARAADFAPGGFERLLLKAGQTLDVGVVYLGGALDPDATNRVEVHVVKEGGDPVAGAQVTATSTLAGALVALGAWEKQPGGTIVRVKTDAKGVAVFDRLPPSFYDIFSEADGLSFASTGLSRVNVQRDTHTTVQLDVSKAMTIDGTVCDEDGKPIPDVRIGAFKFANFTMNPATSTNEDGTFSLGGLSSGAYMLFAVKQGRGQKDVQNVEAGRKDLAIVLPQGSGIAIRVLDAATSQPIREYGVRPFKNSPFAYVYSPGVAVKAEDGVWRQQLDKGQWGIEVTAKGYAMKSLASVPLDGKDPLDVKLDASGIVHGRVVGRNGGGPVRGARVFVQRGGFPPSPEKDQQTATDGAGEFVIDNLARAPIKLTISHVDHTEQAFDAEPVARPDGGGLPPAVEFALPDGGRVAGHAFGPDHKPLVGSQVTLMKGFDLTSRRQAQVGADAAYEFTHVPPDKYTLSIGGGRGQTSQVEVVDGGVVTVDFGADTGGQRVTGRLVRGEDPVAGTNMTLAGGGKSVRATSDAQGRFAFEAVQPGSYTLAPSFMASSVSATVVVKADEAPAEVTLQMPVLGSIEVHVVDDSTGKALNGGWVNYEMTVDADGKSVTEVRGGGGRTPTGDDGVALLENLEAGHYLIRCWRDPYGSEMLEDVALAAGETKTGVTIRLAGAGTLSGKVHDSAGKAIEGAAAQVRDMKGRRVFLVSFANTSADGSFTQGQMKPGEYDVTIEKEGYAPATQHVVTTVGGETKADFTLLKGGSIEVTALRADGQTPLGNAAVTLWDSAGRLVEKGLTLQNIFSNSSARTNASGKLTLNGVAPGRYRVQVAESAAATASQTADVVEGTATPVEVRLAQ